MATCQSFQDLLARVQRIGSRCTHLHTPTWESLPGTLASSCQTFVEETLVRHLGARLLETLLGHSWKQVQCKCSGSGMGLSDCRMVGKVRDQYFGFAKLLCGRGTCGHGSGWHCQCALPTPQLCQMWFKATRVQ